MAAGDTLPSATTPEAEQECLSDGDVLAFAEGSLERTRLASAHEHLDRCETCQHLVNEASHALVTARTAPLVDGDEIDWNCTFKTGAVVAQRYVVLRFVARGGMGEVYEALDRELNERVALKTVTSTACDSPLAVRRLKAEVQLARRVGHQNVCRIYDLGTHVLESTGASLHFLTMEFVEGETLGERIRRAGAFGVDEALKIARGLLRGLSAAHGAGILHRDFKSDNVMLRPGADGRMTPVILDFGLARARDEDGRHVTSATHHHLIGTMDYMAPEQLEGSACSTSSDVYAFGVVWFEMLTGALPFEGSTRTAGALERLRRDPARPSSLNRLVPPALDDVVLRCLSRSRERRFGAPEEVLAALDAMDRLPPDSRRPGRRLLQLALAVGAIGLGAFGALAAVRDRKPSDAVAAPLAPRPPSLQALRTAHPALPALPIAPAAALRLDVIGPTPSSRKPLPRATSATLRPIPSPSTASTPEAEPTAPTPAPPTPEPSRAVAELPSAATTSPTPNVAAKRKPDWENPFPPREPRPD